jgi:hypothetical protein
MKDETRNQILRVLDAHRIMTIATQRPDGWPQATTVGYAHEGLTLYFLCGPGSQKAANLARDDRVSVTIDHDVSDIMAIEGLSMAAHAYPVTDLGEVARIMNLLVHRYSAQQSLPGPLPPPQSVRIFRVEPQVISLLDYSKGFGHTELVNC